MGYVTPKEACNYYGVTHPSLRRWASSDKIKYIRTPGGDFRYWIDENDNSREPNLIRTEIIYTRVANAKYQNAIIEKEIGSGLDFNRKGIQNIFKNNEIFEICETNVKVYFTCKNVFIYHVMNIRNIFVILFKYMYQIGFTI